MLNPTVYLAGAITGTSYEETTNWRATVTQALAESNIICFSPMRGKQNLSNELIIKDNYAHDPLSSQQFIFARDSYDCARCDLIFANLLGATQVSIGTVLEIAWAWSYRKPIILVMENANNPHDHSVIRGACPLRATTLDDGIELVRQMVLP
jgi:nucleoside 2-deoxyribosyltransferase